MIVSQRAMPSHPRESTWEVLIEWRNIDGLRLFYGLPIITLPAFSYEHAHAISAAINSFEITMEVTP